MLEKLEFGKLKHSFDELLRKFNLLNGRVDNISVGNGVAINKEIVINTVDTEISGKQYQNFANAFAYIASLALPPSVTNPWTVKFSGRHTENIIIPLFVSLSGESMTTSILTGTIGVVGAGDLYVSSNYIENCTIENLAIDGTGALNCGISLENVKVTGCTSIGTGNWILARNCVITGGDFTSFNGFYSIFESCSLFVTTSVVKFPVNSYIIGGCIFAGVAHSISFPNINIVNVCIINFGNCDLSGIIIIRKSSIQGAFSVPDQSQIKAFGTFFDDIITINVGGSLTTAGCVLGQDGTFTEPVNNGTWNNYGDSYDDNLTGLTAYNTQTAIAALSEKFGTLGGSGTFTTSDGKTVTYSANGVITGIA